MSAKKAPAKKAVKKVPAKKAKSGAWKMRVRMYRQGLGDCFLVSIRKAKAGLYHIVIDCGVLMGTANPEAELTKVVDDIASETKGVLDLLVITHEHWDHLSGFHQAQASWNKIQIKNVWMGWTENPQDAQARRLSKARNSSLRLLNEACKKLPPGIRDGVESLLQFGGDPVLGVGKKTTASALDFIRNACRNEEGVRYLDPGEGPLTLEGVAGVRVYSLGPPRDEKLLKKSEVLKKDKADGVVYGLHNEARALAAAVGFGVGELQAETAFPFGPEYRLKGDSATPSAEWFRQNYDAEPSRKIDDDWMSAFGDLALKLDNDTNNTSLVLAFELVKSGEVALFVGDAQVGNWQSWHGLEFEMEEGGKPRKLTVSNLIERTKFYKGGHHLSHNATLKKGGLELMQRDDLVVFAPVDKTMAAAQGRVVDGKRQGWEMPAKELFKALKVKAGGRVVLSDRNEAVPSEALQAGVTESAPMLYVEYCF